MLLAEYLCVPTHRQSGRKTPVCSEQPSGIHQQCIFQIDNKAIKIETLIRCMEYGAEVGKIRGANSTEVKHELLCVVLEQGR